MMTRMIKLLFSCTLLLATFHQVSAQEPADTLTLEQRYTDMLRKSGVYQDKKIIRQSNLNMFWAALSDTLQTTQASLKEALVGKMDVEEELRASQDSLRTVRSKLESSLGENSQVSFLGISFGQTFYNSLVWGLILILTAMTAFFFQRFKRGHSVVTETKDEFDKLQQDYDALRHKAKETQMKLKRELQTAMNRLETVENR
ncbi:MAG: hypothetical protein Roseis2KO_08040 [Roseivirga sp.]